MFLEMRGFMSIFAYQLTVMKSLDGHGDVGVDSYWLLPDIRTW